MSEEAAQRTRVENAELRTKLTGLDRDLAAARALAEYDERPESD